MPGALQGSVGVTPNPLFSETLATVIRVEAETEVLSCLHTGRGKKKPKVVTGEDTPLVPANHLVSLHEKEGEERGVRGKGEDGGEACSRVHPDEVNATPAPLVRGGRTPPWHPRGTEARHLYSMLAEIKKCALKKNAGLQKQPGNFSTPIFYIYCLFVHKSPKMISFYGRINRCLIHFRDWNFQAKPYKLPPVA